MFGYQAITAFQSTKKTDGLGRKIITNGELFQHPYSSKEAIGVIKDYLHDEWNIEFQIIATPKNNRTVYQVFPKIISES